MIVRYSPVDNSVIFYLTALCDTDNEADYFEFYNTTRELAKLTVNLCYLSDAYKRSLEIKVVSRKSRNLANDSQ